MRSRPAVSLAARRLALLCLTVAGLGWTAPAAAAVLQQVQAIFDRSGLGGVDAIALSADGLNVYAAGFTDKVLTVFRRDQATGDLSVVDSQIVEQPTSVVVSPDGKFVYVAGFRLSEIKVYGRDGSTGALTLLPGGVQNNQGNVAGIGGVRSLALSHDANATRLYAAGSSDSSIAVFTRDKNTGALGWVQATKFSSGGFDYLAGVRSLALTPAASGGNLYAAADSSNVVSVFDLDSNLLPVNARPGPMMVDGLAGAGSVAVSPDARNVYATGALDNAVVTFDRDATGDLQSPRAIRGAGLGGAASVAVSPDGKNVYVAGETDNAVVTYDREQATGNLLAPRVTKTDGLGGAAAVIVTSDHQNVYVAGSLESAVVGFTCDALGNLGSPHAHYGGASGVEGLAGANSVALSPDDRQLYVAAPDDHAVSVFNRDPLAGTLTFRQLKRNGSVASGLIGAWSVTVSPDGAHVYAAAIDDGPLGNEGALTVFRRNTDTASAAFGQLTFLQTIHNGDQAGLVTGLHGAAAVTVSPSDGAFVYVAGRQDGPGATAGAIAVFARDTSPASSTFGQLTFVEAHHNGGAVQGLAGVESITVSPDGRHLYAAGPSDTAGGTPGAVAVFQRNLATGALQFVEVQRDGGAVQGIGGVLSVAVSPDGSHVYAAGFSDDTLAVFARDAATGKLTFVEAQTNTFGPVFVTGLDGVDAVAVSADGTRVYASSMGNDALVVFDRAPATGHLTFLGAQFDGSGVGLAGAAGVATLNSLSVDGRPLGPSYVYAAGSVSDSVAAFRVVRCGDGNKDGAEECDDGGRCVGGSNAGAACTADGACPGAVCRPGSGAFVCIGGVNQGTVCTADEQCTGGRCQAASGTGCDENCTLRACGNGVQTLGEACDDGRTCVGGTHAGTACTNSADCGSGGICAAKNGDGCDNDTSSGGNCTATACGNGVVTANEACDDHDPNDSNPQTGGICVITNPGGPAGPNNCVAAACGDGFLCGDGTCTSGPSMNSELCDDGGKCVGGSNAGGACTGNAQCPAGQCRAGSGAFVCIGGPNEGTPCMADTDCSGGRCQAGSGTGCDENCAPRGCGNGVRTLGELCDNGAGTSGGCIVTDPGGPSGETNCAPARCGDGFVCSDPATCHGGLGGGPETCDQPKCVGSANAGSPCHSNADCPSGACQGTNGDGCDDDASNGGNCSATACGNGVKTDSEECDDGAKNCQGLCSDHCRLGLAATPGGTSSWCGNGLTECKEKCDLGPLVNSPGSGCTPDCRVEHTSCRERLSAMAVSPPSTAVSDAAAGNTHRRTRVCHDGDPQCDESSTPDGECVFTVEFCLGVHGVDPQCNPQTVASVDLLGLDTSQCWQADVARNVTTRLAQMDPEYAVDVPPRCSAGIGGKLCTMDRDCDSKLGRNDGVCGVGTGVVFPTPVAIPTAPPTPTPADPVCAKGIRIRVPVGHRLRLHTQTQGALGADGRPNAQMDADDDRLRLVCRPAAGVARYKATPRCDTPTPAATPTDTATATATVTATDSATATASQTLTPTVTDTATLTATQTPTVTDTPTAAATPTQTATATNTATMTRTATNTRTRPPTRTARP
jgi:6-phosphogluconolactonase (cycloisomerase 2 family)